MSEWKAEKVKYNWLKQGTPFYYVNPNENKYAYPHYAGDSLDPDLEVWVLYEPWLLENPYLKDGYGCQ